MKRLSLIVTFLFLAFITTACFPVTTDYNIRNGKEIACTVASYPSYDNGQDGICTWPYYESTADNGNITSLVECYPDSGLKYNIIDGKIEATTQCSPITPTAVPPTTSKCVPKYAYDNLTDGGQSWIVVSRQQDTNNSVSPIQVSFSATTTKTVTVTDEEQLTVSLSASVDVTAIITASVQAQINHSVSQSVTVSVSNSPTLSIPSGEIGYANYGVSVQITSGHLYDKAKCEGSKSDRGTDITYVPIAAGWCLWLAGETPCPSV